MKWTVEPVSVGHPGFGRLQASGRRSPYRNRLSALRLGLAVLAAGGILTCARAAEETTDFIRFVDLGPGEGKLETAVVTYGKDGVEVDLIAAVHVGDRAYYDRLDERFKAYDAVLYEMIKPAEREVKPGGSGGMLRFFQRGLKDALGLEFQLDAVDYSRKNFRHADLDPETFFRLQRERGESILSFLMNAMLKDMEKQLSGKGKRRAGLIDLIAAFSARDSTRSLKLLLARELEDMEVMIGDADGGEGAGASVLIAERNKAASKALAAAIDRGGKKLAIFYGAAHMRDLERRLRDEFGLKKKKTEWLAAWDIRKAKEKAKRQAEPEPEPERRSEAEERERERRSEADADADSAPRKQTESDP